MIWHPAPAQPNQNNQVTQPAEGGDNEKMRISLQISQATLPSHVAIPGRQLLKANAPRATPVLQPHEQPQ
ncbi:hypothetical protein XFEB_00840 [Xylella fastidiosa EB92.1]|nr:hypothetical protein XFEB_00840 [Xylella fastidiosa EB92.1]